MSKHDESRRAFLVGAAGVGAVAATGLVGEAQAQSPAQHGPGDAASHMQPGGEGMGAFFNADNAVTVSALTERLMPGAPGKPGARDAGVLNYIDLALAGAYADQQDFYRSGLTQLDAYCRATYKQPFRRLPPAQQDEVVAALESGKASGFAWPSAVAFFNTLRTHTMEGMFADPVYGGNRDFAGWRLVGFPGAQMMFTTDDMQSKEAFTRLPVIGLQAEGKTAKRRI